MERQYGLIIIILMMIGAIVIPLGIMMFRGVTTKPLDKWHYYIEPGIFTATEEVHIDDVKYTLDTFIWRDFFPPSPSNGRPLIVIINVYTRDLAKFPLLIRVERLWLINETDIISTLATEEYLVEGGTFVMVFRDGPKWDPGIYIDVVVKLISVYSSEYYLMAKNQLIHG